MYPSTGQRVLRAALEANLLTVIRRGEGNDTRPSREQMATSVKTFIINHKTERKKPLSHLTFLCFKNFEVYLWQFS